MSVEVVDRLRVAGVVGVFELSWQEMALVSRLCGLLEGRPALLPPDQIESHVKGAAALGLDVRLVTLDQGKMMVRR